ncbi:hypothetical protein PGTUg99_033354 [Puccinia graminis f. sp. tritici]|uniref:Uncharacterized protein n=1 Tax=Puccinia graminis f. sp. tritici TaxID=56615 RepID=A0A5B0RNC9_PUCGR|nr:hypothetical protein PGTUg99_033354 [Puccinia graminis f. sp. tritici]
MIICPFRPTHHFRHPAAPHTQQHPFLAGLTTLVNKTAPIHLNLDYFQLHLSP